METECGKIIAENRKRLGWTQAELGAELNVTAQAVSKWEKGNAEPDLATLQRLAEIFGVSVGEFFGESKEKVETPPADAPVILVGYCNQCKTPIRQNEDYHIYPATRGAAQRIVCADCYAKNQAAAKQSAYAEEQKKFRRSMIVASLLAALVAVIGVILAITSKNPLYCISIAVAAGLFMFVAQCFWTSYALDLLLFFCRSFRLPGLIFTLDLDGILWFITVKLLFGILTGILSVLAFGFGLCLSMVVGMVTFPFCFARERRNLRQLRQAAQSDGGSEPQTKTEMESETEIDSETDSEGE